MRDRGLLRIGILGTVIAALCCFTPLLVILLGAVGLSAAIGWLDYVLIPALALFAGITIYAMVRRQAHIGGCRESPKGGPSGRARPERGPRAPCAGGRAT
jgi:mercuric ion transport protein